MKIIYVFVLFLSSVFFGNAARCVTDLFTFSHTPPPSYFFYQVKRRCMKKDKERDKKKTDKKKTDKRINGYHKAKKTFHCKAF